MDLITDAMLGKLTRYLRMAGHDVVYIGDLDVEGDDEIAEKTKRGERTLVTRDTELASLVDNSILIESLTIEDQLKEVFEAGIELELDVPERCSVCNSRLEKTNERPEHAPDSVANIWKCVNCGQYFWKGSHWDDVKDRISSLDLRDGS
ncbi:MAG: Mut7-C RNAse domain-containing protein [Halobacteria archaeon]|nr:Mut7-C RNAse domain-containing protein [Halobacteria archaeon]